MNTIAVKNLCIGLEALSRISGYDAERQGQRVRQLLDEALTKAEEQVQQEKDLKQTQKPQPKPTPSASDKDDEIPF